MFIYYSGSAMGGRGGFIMLEASCAGGGVDLFC